MRPRELRWAIALMLATTLVAACGTDDDDAAGTAPAVSDASDRATTPTSPPETAAPVSEPASATVPATSTAPVTVADTEPAEPITLTFESYTYGTESAGPGTQQLIDEFEALHPNIMVDAIGTPSADIHVSVATKAAAGNPPDVAQIGWSKFSFVLENLPYVPVQEIAGGEWADHIAGIYPSAVAIGERDGEVIGLPSIVSIPTLFYNADLFTAAGLDPDSPPANWDEVAAAATAIAAATDAEGVYVGVVDPAKSDYLTQSLLYSNGSGGLGHDLARPGAVHLDSLSGRVRVRGRDRGR